MTKSNTSTKVKASVSSLTKSPRMPADLIKPRISGSNPTNGASSDEGVRYYWVYVTVDMCRTFLGTVDKRRPIRKSHVINIAEAISNGTFYGDVATIKFVGDEDTGHMRDGVHRCMAGVRAEKGFWTWVGYGYTDEMIAVTDGGIKRTPGDVLGFYDFEDTAMLAATLRWLLCFKRGYMDMSNSRRPPSNALVPYANRHAKHLYPIMAEYRKPAHLTGSFVSSIFYMGSVLMGEHERTKSFCDAFRYGFSDGVFYKDPSINPAIQWFTRLQNERTQGRRYVEAVKAMRTIQAFNAFLKGEPAPSFTQHIERITINGLKTGKI